MIDVPKDGTTPLAPDETEGLIPAHLSTREQLNRLEQENITESMQWLETARLGDILSELFIRKLHRHMFGWIWRWAGHFRTSDKNIGVLKETIGIELRNLCDDTKAQIEHSAYPADEIAYRFHHRLVWIHPFVNGNGRHARLFTDLLLEKRLNRERFSWGSVNLADAGKTRDEYLKALRAADKGDYALLAKFVRS